MLGDPWLISPGGGGGGADFMKSLCWHVSQKLCFRFLDFTLGKKALEPISIVIFIHWVEQKQEQWLNVYTYSVAREDLYKVCSLAWKKSIFKLLLEASLMCWSIMVNIQSFKFSIWVTDCTGFLLIYYKRETLGKDLILDCSTSSALIANTSFHHTYLFYSPVFHLCCALSLCNSAKRCNTCLQTAWGSS